VASPQTRRTGRQKRGARTWRSIGSAMSSATTSLAGQRPFITVLARPGPLPTSSTRAGTRVPSASSCSSRRDSTSRCSTATSA
jgi:hypothetical protein